MKIELLNINSELGAGTRGASLGIPAMRVADWKRKGNFFKRFSTRIILDENEALYDAIDTPFAKRIESIHRVFERVAYSVSETVANDVFPVVLAGDHSTAAATIAGLRIANPDKRLGVIWVDAHADLHSPYSSPSGNVHGMPLAISIAEDNIENQINLVTGKAKLHWEKLKNLGGICPKISPEDIVFFGVRDTETPEDFLIEKYGIRNITVEEVRKNGIKQSVAEALHILFDCDMIYISFDVDSMDCDLVSHGTGTPVKNGFTPEEALDIMKGICDSGKLACLELVEVNPTLDEKENKMAETALDVLDNLVQYIENKLNNE